MNSRIAAMTLDDGRPIEASKTYKVAGWATVGAKSPGPPVWEIVADYLRSEQAVKIDKVNTPVLKNVSANSGLADYSGLLE